MATKRNSQNKVVMSSGAAAAPARRTSPTPQRASNSAAATVSSTSEVLAVETAVEPATEVSSEAVARLAFTYWAGRGYQGGSPEEDWLRAEQELRAAVVLK